MAVILQLQGWRGNMVVFLGHLCSLQPYSSYLRKRIRMKILQVLITFLLTKVSLFFLTYRKLECVLYSQTHFLLFKWWICIFFSPSGMWVLGGITVLLQRSITFWCLRLYFWINFFLCLYFSFWSRCSFSDEVRLKCLLVLPILSPFPFLCCSEH